MSVLNTLDRLAQNADWAKQFVVEERISFEIQDLHESLSLLFDKFEELSNAIESLDSINIDANDVMNNLMKNTEFAKMYEDLYTMKESWEI